jgi:RNA polymerase sigma-70 factor (ECF subfamily)
LHRGDPAVLDGLLDQYWTPLVTYAATLLRSWDAAEDVVQETFVRIWERRESWSTAGSVRALLFQIARNLALDETRRRDRHLTLLDGESPMARRITTPADELEGAELEAAYREALANLPERRREVFLLSRQHGLSYREIADTMDISPQTVANQLSAALAELRRSLESFLG